MADSFIQYPFGFHPGIVTVQGYTNNGYGDATQVGAHWARGPTYAYWSNVQPNLSTNQYDFTELDASWGHIPTNFSLLVNIAPEPRTESNRCVSGSWIPIDQVKYTSFVYTVVERFDGDGVNDMPGLDSPVHFWQVGNEPNNLERTNFWDLQRITYQAIKAADSNATVLIGGADSSPPADYATDFNGKYRPILEHLDGQYADIFDFHWFGTATGEYRMVDGGSGSNIVSFLRATLQACHFPSNMPIWVTETGTYSGSPTNDGATYYPPQTEQQQARDLVKRLVSPLGTGVKKTFWAWGLIEGLRDINALFDHTGLIYDGRDPDDLGLGVHKLGYFAYQKLAAETGDANWSGATNAYGGSDANTVMAFRVPLNVTNQALHIVWWDYFREPNYTEGDQGYLLLTNLLGCLAYVAPLCPAGATTGQMVTNHAAAFPTSSYAIANGQVAVPLGTDPILVKSESLALWLRCEQTNSGVAPDSSGSGNHGQVYNVTMDPTGRLGAAYRFNGTNSYVRIGDFDYGTNFTLALWFKAAGNQGTGAQTMVSHGLLDQSNSVNVFLSEESAAWKSNQLRTTVLDVTDNTDDTSLLLTNTFTDSQWHQYALVVSSSGSVVYIDGVARASSAWGGGAYNPATNFHVGADGILSASRFFQGSFDDIRVYPLALSSNRVRDLQMAATVTYTVSVSSAYGMALPAVGVYTNYHQSQAAYMVTSAVAVGQGTQYVCRGWTGTGSVPAHGSSSNLWIVALTTNSAIAWQWGTNYQLTAQVVTGGTVSSTNAWYPQGSVATITAAPEREYDFLSWTGDVPPEAQTNNPVQLTMDRARAIQANFNARPLAFGSANPTSGMASLQVLLRGILSSDADGTITNYAWDFTTDGILDVQGANRGEVTNVYTSAGTQTCTLVVTDNNGGRDTDTVTILVAPDTVPPQIASVTAVSSTRVQVVYSDWMNPATVSDPLNYGVNNGVCVTSATLNVDGKTVDLGVSPLSFFQYVLSVSNVVDFAGANPIAPGTQVLFEYTDPDRIAYEGFDVYGTGSLTGQGTTAQGWANGWSGLDIIQVAAMAIPLAYVHSPAITVTGGARAAWAPYCTNTSYASHPLELSRGFSNTYVSFLIRLDGAITGSRNGFYLNAAVLANQDLAINGGFSTTKAKASLAGERYFQRVSTVAGQEGPDLVSNTTYMIVLKIQGDGLTQWTNATLYVNPQSRTAEVAAYTNTPIPCAFSNDIGYINLRLVDIGTNSEVYIDEIRVGRTWRSVVPASVQSLQINSLVGAPIPPRGTFPRYYGEAVTCSMPESLLNVNNTQYLCVGYAGTGSATNGTGVVTTIVITNNSTLTWLWDTNFYYLNLQADPHGAVSPTSNWFHKDSTQMVTALASNWYHFLAWSGDVDPGAVSNNPLAVRVDQPRVITAQFAATLATNGVPQWWLAQLGWTNNFDSAAFADPDGDGAANWTEWFTGTSPTNRQEVLRFLAVAAGPETNGCQLTWELRSNRWYRLLAYSNLLTTNSQVLTSGIWTATNRLMIYTDAVPPVIQRMYRVLVDP